VLFLAHYTGGGINDVLDLCVEDFFLYLDAAAKFYKLEIERPIRVVLSGIENKR